MSASIIVKSVIVPRTSEGLARAQESPGRSRDYVIFQEDSCCICMAVPSVFLFPDSLHCPGEAGEEQAEMVRECVVAECGTHARFNHPGETHGIFCSKHKIEGMR